jgi:ATP-dependent Lhr-like helicase
MEEAGKVRRGYFVEGIGAQFAYVGAVDRLRGMRDALHTAQVVTLSAADPANPYGWVLPWPTLSEGESRQPKRHAGATLVLVDGEATIYLDRGGKALSTFAGVVPERLKRGMAVLVEMIATRNKKMVRIEDIDGEPALRSPHASLFKEVGMTFDHRGLIIERKV